MGGKQLKFRLAAVAFLSILLSCSWTVFAVLSSIPAAAATTETKLYASDGVAGASFGSTLGIDGNTALIGAPEDNNSMGSAYVFVRNGSTWSQQAKLTPTDASGERFGWSVSLGGDTALVGALFLSNNTGSVYVFVRNGSTWSQQAKLATSDPVGGDAFGGSLSLSGDTALIGAGGANNYTGAAYIFVRNGTIWSQQARLTSSDGAVQFGSGSVSVSGDTALIPAQDPSNLTGADYTGVMYVFVRNGTIWSQQAKLTAGDGEGNFAGTTSLSGDTALVGAAGIDDYRDAAYVFVRNGTTWSLQAKLIPGDSWAYAEFVRSVSVDRDNVLIGAPTNSAAYVFVRNESTWSQAEKLRASDVALGFGWGGVSVSGDTFLVGAGGGNGRVQGSGAAYVFRLTPPQPTPPSAPRRLRATQGIGRITLSWQAPSSDGGSPITHYRVYRGNESGSEAFLAEIGNELNFTDEPVPNGATYVYQVSASNAKAEGPRSNEASVGGNIWTNPSPAPIARSAHSIAYNSAGDRVILFGGSAGGDETWTLDPATNSWTKMNPTSSPPGRANLAMAYDSKSDRIILFGGYSADAYGDLGDTWAYDFANNTWTNVTPTWGPSPRDHPAMAYDSESDRVILFGGSFNTPSYGLLLKDTWAYDFTANTWTEMANGPEPGAGRYAMAYDSVHDRVVMFGGGSGSGNGTWAYDFNNNSWDARALGPLYQNGGAMTYVSAGDRVILFGNGETWAYEFVNDTWLNMMPGQSPPALSYHAVTYDTAESRVILFGGNYGADFGDTWTYDLEANNWEEVTPLGGPSARGLHAMAYDSRSDRVILFGGRNYWYSSGYVGDTWAYDFANSTWTNVTPASGPSSRVGHAIAYDSRSDRVILFGGEEMGLATLADTWAFDFDTNSWTNMTPSFGPPALVGPAMVYDSKSDRIVLFGGELSGLRDSFFGETWAYDFANNTWKNMTPASGPSARAGHAMAYDSRSNRVILFGGGNGGGNLGDTWAYDLEANTWADVTPIGGPSPRGGHAMAYDSLFDRVILFGGTGTGGGNLGDTWAYDFGRDIWTNMNPVPGPSARAGHAMVYDTAEQAVVLFGGFSAFAGGLSDTWWYRFPGSPPSPPEDPQAVGDNAQAVLTWQPPSDDGGWPITNYRIYRGTTSGGESFLTEVGNVLSYTDTGLTNGVTYYYQVSAVNAVGEGAGSDEVSATPSALPEPPTVPSAVSSVEALAGDGQVALTWSAPTSDGGSPITNYRIYRGTTSGGESFLTEVGNVLSYTDTGLTNGVTYYYQVSAVNAVGEGPRGPEISVSPTSAIPGPGPPPSPWIPVIGAGILLVTAAAFVTLQHTRILRENVLQRKVRMLMFEYTRDHPGSSFSAVRDAVGLKNGVAAYHLRVLEKQGLVHSKSHRRHRWFYPNGDVSLWRDIPLSPLQLSLINEVQRAPGLGIRELARAVDRRASSVAYNVKALVREDLLRTKRVGSKLCCFAAGHEGSESAASAIAR